MLVSFGYMQGFYKVFLTSVCQTKHSNLWKSTICSIKRTSWRSNFI